MLAESLPIAERRHSTRLTSEDDEDWELFGASKDETQAFAAQCLTRRLKAIGLG